MNTGFISAKMAGLNKLGQSVPKCPAKFNLNIRLNFAEVLGEFSFEILVVNGKRYAKISIGMNLYVFRFVSLCLSVCDTVCLCVFVCVFVVDVLCRIQ